jgi:hypothetical protein
MRSTRAIIVVPKACDEGQSLSSSLWPGFARLRLETDLTQPSSLPFALRDLSLLPPC